jgi:hypothetical protein
VRPADHDAAQAWLTAERAVLLRVVEFAPDVGHPDGMTGEASPPR